MGKLHDTMHHSTATHATMKPSVVTAAQRHSARFAQRHVCLCKAMFIALTDAMYMDAGLKQRALQHWGSENKGSLHRLSLPVYATDAKVNSDKSLGAG